MNLNKKAIDFLYKFHAFNKKIFWRLIVLSLSFYIFSNFLSDITVRAEKNLNFYNSSTIVKLLSNFPKSGFYKNYNDGSKRKYIYEGSPLKGLYKEKSGFVYFNNYDGFQLRGAILNVNGFNYYFNKDNGLGTEIAKLPNGQYEQKGNNWIYKMPDGSNAHGLKSINNNIQYFDHNTGYQLKGGAVDIGGTYYYFDLDTGNLISSVNENYNSGHYLNSDGHVQYIDKNIVKGLVCINGNVQYFNPKTGYQVKNSQVYTNGVTYYFDNNGNGKYLFTNISKNVNYQFNSHDAVNSTNLKDYKNLVDGFLTAKSWYRPKYILDGGKNWRLSNKNDYRPIITRWWPNKNIQVNYLKLMQNNGLIPNKLSYSVFSDQNILDKGTQLAKIGIEKRIKIKHGTKWLSKLLFSDNNKNKKSFIKSQFIWSSDSEYPNQGGDQWFQGGYLKYENNPLTPTTNSKYRNAENSFEFLLANDVDNSNPIVQAENLNWLYYVMNFGSITTNGVNNNSNFDGIRLDAAMNISTDMVKRTFDFLNESYDLNKSDAKANKHISITEGGIGDGGPTSINNNALISSQFEENMQKSLANSSGNNSSLENLITDTDNGVTIANHNDPSNNVIPNYSYVHSHDMGIQDYIRKALKDSTGADWNDFTQSELKKGLDTYYNDQESTNKKYNMYNLPSAYSLLLTNNDTVPRVYYGDMYKDDGQYMQHKSIYYDVINSLMLARKKYVAGGQSINVDSSGILTSVRYGKGASNSTSVGNYNTRHEGIGVIVGNDSSLNLKDGYNVKLNMGMAHKNQAYRALLLTTKNGIKIYNSDFSSPTTYTDKNGYLTFNNKKINNQPNTQISGTLNPKVSGYLSVWVPVGARKNQDARTNFFTGKNNDGKIFHSNDFLNSNLIYEGFSNFQPSPTGNNNFTNVVIAKKANLFKKWGVTDFEMAPQYSSSNDHTFLDSTINNGYAFSDRYNLGFNKPTKYGTVPELRNSIRSLHRVGIQVMADIVYNQLYHLPGNEVVQTTRSNVYGNNVSLPFGTQLYVTSTIGGGKYQSIYGGKFLKIIKRNHPNLFKLKKYKYYKSNGTIGERTMPEISDKYIIKRWSAKYMDGTNLLGEGMGYVLKDWNTGKYFKVNNKKTVLPNNLYK